MPDQEDDEITIDFSAIKRWFSKKPTDQSTSKHPAHTTPHTTSEAASKSREAPPHPPSHPAQQESSETDISLDLHHLTKPFLKFFGSATTAQPEPHARSSHPKTDEGIALSWSSLKKFFITYHLLFLILIPLFIAYDIRIQTRYLPITETWARDTIYNNIRGQISAQVSREYPHLPEAQRNDIISKEFNTILAAQKDQLETQIKNQAAYFKSRFNDDKGHTVLLDIDSYSYFRETRNLLTYGHNGNTKVNGTDWDTYIMAPRGVPAGKNLHNYLGVWQFKLWRLFDKDIYLMKSFFYLPVMVYLLAVIPAFMIGTYYGGWFGGIVSGTILAVHPAVLTRTQAGVTDTDVYQVLFPLLVVFTFLEAYRRKTKTGMYIVASLAGVLLGIYSFAWSGWWLIFYFLVTITLLHMISQIYHHTEKGRINLSASWKRIAPVCIMLGLFILFTAIVTTILRDFRFFLGFYTEPFAFLALKIAANPNLWPNVYTTVAELNPISLEGAIAQISFGSNLLFYLSLLGIILAFFKRDEEGHIDIKLTALLAMWFASTLWASKSGVRFVGLAVPAFSIALGACFGIITMKGSRLLEQHLRIPELASKIILVLLLSLLLVNPVKAGYVSATHNIPLISDAWWQALSDIKEKSSPNAIISSWWDFGHWFKSIADRPSTFDGGTQNTPIAHWVGKLLLTADEDQAIGILRMLDCGSYQAAAELEAQGLPILSAVNLLYSVFNKTREEARQAYIAAGVPNPESVLTYTHCDPPEAFLITSADMVGKSGVWAHFGSWDFKRSKIWFDRNNGSFDQRVADIVTTLNFTKQEAENLQREVLAIREEGEANTWIAPWPSFGGGSACTKQQEILMCQNGLLVNLTTMNVLFSGETSPIHGLTYIDRGQAVQKIYQTYAQDISIALVPSGDQLNAVFMQYPLGLSMFTRLFYLEGHGLSHFKRFSDKTSVLGERIIVWKVDWEGKTSNVYYPYNITTPPPTPSNRTPAAPRSSFQKNASRTPFPLTPQTNQTIPDNQSSLPKEKKGLPAPTTSPPNTTNTTFSQPTTPPKSISNQTSPISHSENLTRQEGLQEPTLQPNTTNTSPTSS